MRKNNNNITCMGKKKNNNKHPLEQICAALDGNQVEEQKKQLTCVVATVQ